MTGALAAVAATLGDKTPSAANWGNISDTDGDGVNSDVTLTGFSGSINLRAVISDTAGTGNVPTLRAVVNASDQSSVAIADTNAALCTVVPGDNVHFKATIASGGPKTCTVTVTNQSGGGATLDTFTVSIQV